MLKLANLKFKDDRTLIAFALVVLVGVFSLMVAGKVSIAAGSAFLAAAFGFPSLVGLGEPKPPPPAETPDAFREAALAALPKIPQPDDDEEPPPPTQPETPSAMGKAAAIIFAVGLASASAAACVPPAKPGQTEAQRATAAELSYGAELQACVAAAKKNMPDDTSASRTRANAEADACAANVDARWVPKDGGAK